MRFKVGDKVRVKKGFQHIRGSISAGSIPKKYEGKELTIKKVYRNHYVVEESELWRWADEWLEPVEKSEDEKFAELLRGEIK